MKLGVLCASAVSSYIKNLLVFAAMPTKPKFVELVIRDLAKISERKFRWEIR